jgi:hypothetical protein
MTVLLLAPEDAIQTRTQCQRHGVMLRRWHDRTRRSHNENYTHECDFETSIDQIMVNMNDISNKGNPRRNGPRLVRMDIAMEVSYRR